MYNLQSCVFVYTSKYQEYKLLLLLLLYWPWSYRQVNKIIFFSNFGASFVCFQFSAAVIKRVSNIDIISQITKPELWFFL